LGKRDRKNERKEKESERQCVAEKGVLASVKNSAVGQIF
jgi:hypothetical protein